MLSPMVVLLAMARMAMGVMIIVEVGAKAGVIVVAKIHAKGIGL